AGQLVVLVGLQVFAITGDLGRQPRSLIGRYFQGVEASLVVILEDVVAELARSRDGEPGLLLRLAGIGRLLLGGLGGFLRFRRSGQETTAARVQLHTDGRLQDDPLDPTDAVLLQLASAGSGRLRGRRQFHLHALARDDVRLGLALVV